MSLDSLTNPAQSTNIIRFDDNSSIFSIQTILDHHISYVLSDDTFNLFISIDDVTLEQVKTNDNAIVANERRVVVCSPAFVKVFNTFVNVGDSDSTVYSVLWTGRYIVWRDKDPNRVF